MPTLREVQAAFARGIAFADEDEALGMIEADGIGAAGRLSVYRNTYRSTLVAALRQVYPAVERLVGAEFFEGAALPYVAGEPPGSAYLNEYGGGFAGFLAEFAPAAALPYLADVARLEWAASQAANAPDAPALDPVALARLDAAEQAEASLRPHPSVRLIALAYPAERIWRAVRERDDAALAALDPRPDPHWLLVQRRDDGLGMRTLARAEGDFTAQLFLGVRLGEALERFPGAEFPALLAEHLACGRFAAPEESSR